MSKIEKRLLSLENNKYKGCTFREAKSIYEHFGFYVKNTSGGSHYSITHQNLKETIILPNHHGNLLPPVCKRDV